MPRAVKNSAEEKETKSKAKATSTVKKSTKAKSTTVSKAKKETKTAKSTTPKKAKKVVKKAVKMIKPSDLLETVKASEVKKSADVTTPKKTTKTVKKVEDKKVTEPKETKSADSKKTTKAVKVEEPKKVTKKAVAKKTTSTAKKTDTTKKATATKTTTKKATATKKVATKKTTKATTKKASTKKVATVKPVKKVTKKVAKVTSLATKRKSSTTSKTKKVKEVQKDFANILEYYDLPYRYNDTIVKILAQTPKVLFVYWDISDSDRENYIQKYGEYFFNDTYPVLIIHNKTLNYYQELEINDFANSWYISISDSRSEYTVELGRRFKEYAKRNENQPHKEDLNNLIYIKKSNNLIVPNDRVLLDEIGPKVKYRNVKTGEEFYKDTRTILAGNKLIDFYELYKGIYQVEDLSNFFVLNNPSSGNPTSTFK